MRIVPEERFAGGEGFGFLLQLHDGFCVHILCSLFLWHKHIGDRTFSLEHGAPIEPDNDDGTDYDEEVVPRLGVGPDRIVQLEMDQRGEKDASA